MHLHYVATVLTVTKNSLMHHITLLSSFRFITETKTLASIYFTFGTLVSTYYALYSLIVKGCVYTKCIFSLTVSSSIHFTGITKKALDSTYTSSTPQNPFSSHYNAKSKQKYTSSTHQHQKTNFEFTNYTSVPSLSWLFGSQTQFFCS